MEQIFFSSPMSPIGPILQKFSVSLTLWFMTPNWRCVRRKSNFPLRLCWHLPGKWNVHTPYGAHWLQWVSGDGEQQMVDLSHSLLEGGVKTHNPPPTLPLTKPHWPKGMRAKRLNLPWTTVYHLAGTGWFESSASYRVPLKSGRGRVSEMLTSLTSYHFTHSHCYHPH